MQEDVLAALRARLTFGHYTPGQKMKPEALRAEFNCSATTLREALFRLSTEGLVEFRDQRGFRVPELSESLRHELTHLRILLETEGGILSVRLGDVSWEAQLSAAHHKLTHIETRVRSDTDQAGLVPIWSAAELEFHQTLISACGSDALKRTHAQIYHQFRQQIITEQRQFGYFPQNVKQHKAILNAALDRDEDGLREAINDHLARNYWRS